jgi:hypothetical protein
MIPTGRRNVVGLMSPSWPPDLFAITAALAQGLSANHARTAAQIFRREILTNGDTLADALSKFSHL